MHAGGADGLKPTVSPPQRLHKPGSAAPLEPDRGGLAVHRGGQHPPPRPPREEPLGLQASRLSRIISIRPFHQARPCTVLAAIASNMKATAEVCAACRRPPESPQDPSIRQQENSHISLPCLPALQHFQPPAPSAAEGGRPKGGRAACLCTSAAVK